MTKPTKYPGMRPVFSVSGTNRSGNRAAPTFQLAVAQYRFGNGSFCTFHRGDIQSLPDPYEPAGRPVKIETKHTVTVTIHLYLGDQLKLTNRLAGILIRSKF